MRKPQFRIYHLLMIAAVLLSFCFASAHESCCKHKLAAAAAAPQEEFIVDPTDLQPPDEYLGQMRWIPDPDSVMPSDWDEEDDGEWQPGMIENPEYKWQPRTIRNPNYVPPINYWNKLLSELMQAVPWVILGVLLTAVLEVLQLPLDSLRNHLSGSLTKAALVGLATPLCSCGALPIAAGFVANGVPLASALAFLTASQSAGLDSAAITWGLLGPMAALARLGGAVVLAVAAGMALGNKKTAAKSTTSHTGGYQDTKAKRHAVIGSPSGAIPMLFALVETAWEIFPMVFIGLAFSTAVVHHLPSLSNVYENILGDTMNTIIGPFLVRMVVLLSALPLQLCEHTTVTLAAGIQQAGGSAGLAFSFLLSAPATNLPSLILLMQASKQNDKRAVLRVAVALVGAALVLSYLVDATGVDMLVEKEAANNDGAMGLSMPSWYVTASPWIASLLLVVGFASTCRARVSKNQQEDCSCCDVPVEKDKKQN